MFDFNSFCCLFTVYPTHYYITHITILKCFRYQGGKFPKKQKGFEAHLQADVPDAKETFFIAAA